MTQTPGVLRLSRRAAMLAQRCGAGAATPGLQPCPRDISAPACGTGSVASRPREAILPLRRVSRDPAFEPVPAARAATLLLGCRGPRPQRGTSSHPCEAGALSQRVPGSFGRPCPNGGRAVVIVGACWGGCLWPRGEAGAGRGSPTTPGQGPSAPWQGGPRSGSGCLLGPLCLLCLLPLHSLWPCPSASMAGTEQALGDSPSGTPGPAKVLNGCAICSLPSSMHAVWPGRC